MYDNVIASAKEHILLAAHRGYCAGNIPCNTIAAYQAALDAGADIIEIDVTPSVDKQLFVFHPGMEYPHLRTRKNIRALTASAVKRLRYVNADRVKTDYVINTLDEVFEFLNGKCYINVDKFWTAMPEITACIRRHGLQKQVIVKTPVDDRYFDMLEQTAPELAYIPMVKHVDNVSQRLAQKDINLIGVEALFTSDSDEIVSDAYIEDMHKRGLLLWGNPIVYNCRDVIASNHTDDTAIMGDKETGWLWFYKKGFDIVQTDWMPMLKSYYVEQGVHKPAIK